MVTILMWASLPDASCYWILPFNAIAFWMPQHHSRWVLSPSHTSVSGPIFQGSLLKTSKWILCPAETLANRLYSTLEQDGLELHGSTHKQIFFFNKYLHCLQSMVGSVDVEDWQCLDLYHFYSLIEHSGFWYPQGFYNQSPVDTEGQHRFWGSPSCRWIFNCVLFKDQLHMIICF